ncbi:unnamed protein product [Phaedon cochleariae]|uniref:Kinesin-like protein n=1 Tax=Phaedon cochleariae TaxID=80249 RepID=A0A9P0DK87_PHACE|nr:unnamed protein product [Phaedon cochleariae]
MDPKSKLPKPSGLRAPQVFTNPRPLSDNKQNLPNVAAIRPEVRAGPRPVFSRLISRRSKSVTDLRPISERVQSQRLRPKPKVEPSVSTDRAEPPSSIKRAPVKRPAISKTDDDIKPKSAKQTRQVKIPDWDYKTRFQNLSEKYNKVVDTLKTAKSDLADLESIKSELENKRVRLIDLEEKDIEQRRRLNELTNLEADFQDLQEKHYSLKKLQLEQSIELDRLLHVEKDFIDMKQKYDVLKTLEHEKSIKLELLSHVQDDLTQLTTKFESLCDEASFLRQKVIDAELMRRKYHNTIQDLKGNIRVFCRVRPPVTDAELTKPQCFIGYTSESVIEIKKTKESVCPSTGKPPDIKAEFVFDRVFSPACTQTEFFEELSQLVQSALDGYDVCVFAYGQTGSGKTYTMQGDSSPEHLGMIPRSVNLIFETIDSLAKSNWVYTVKVSFLEIYNDNVRDLLDPKGTQNLEICHNEGKGTTVSNLKIQQIHSPKDFHDLMTSALKHRMVAATNFNELSSRSHAVTKIYLHGSNSAAAVSYTGSVNLVDLAGSESAKTSLGERLVETKSINKSLSALGTVMLALYNKNSHVPYRNSKLTYLLQSCLGGTSKTLMIVNVPPFEEHYSESINSLRFASKVKQVKNLLKRNRAVSPAPSTQ